MASRPPSHPYWLLDRLATIALVAAAGCLLLFVHGEIDQRRDARHLQAARFERQAPELQAAIFDLTGRIETALVAIDSGLRRGDAAGLAEAGRVFEDELNPLFDEWSSRKQLLRVQTAQVFGRAVSEALVDPTDNSLVADDCGVVVFAASPERNQNCGARREAERDALRTELDDAEWASAMLGRKDAGEDEFLTPYGFDHNFFLLRHMISRYLRCRSDTATGPADPRSARICGDLDQSRDILAFRLALLISARQNVAERLMEVSAVP